MKNHFLNSIWRKAPVVLFIVVLGILAGVANGAPPGTAFSYQGRLNEGANPANGSYVFRFTVFDQAGNGNAVGTPITTSPMDVSNGLFTVTLDFGAGIFTGANRWLSIEVHTNDNASLFVALTPLQPILPTPYAMYSGYSAGVDATGISGNIPAGSLSGSYPNPLNLPNVNNTFTGTFTGNGAGVTGVDAATLGGLSSSSFWKLGGNALTTPGTHFLGTTDNQPLEIKVNGLRALRIENNGDSAYDPFTAPDGAPNLIGGSPVNFVAAGVVGATIGGGGSTNYFGFPLTNSVSSDFGVVGGGLGNEISTNLVFETIAGGFRNYIGPRLAENISVTFGYSSMNVIGGGCHNTIEAFPTLIVDYGGNTIAGGIGNGVGSNLYAATISGGVFNLARSDAGTIGGGSGNVVSGVAATVPGGAGNAATAAGTFAAGTRAMAAHEGAFAWADRQSGTFSTDNTNQFAVRAQNGVMIQGTATALDLRGDGAIRVAGAGVGSLGPVFIHRATAASISGHITTIDHPLANGDPNAILLVTHNFSADTSGTPYEPNAVGVWYNGSRWTIYHENTSVAMPVGRAFNVMIIKP